MLRLLLLAALTVAMSAKAETERSDPFAWLEDIHSPRAMAWVAQQNAASAARLEGDKRYALFHRQALTVLTAPDRIPKPTFLGEDVANFWQDGAHVKGLWRRSSKAAYDAGHPAWETLLDLDALSKAEGKNWIFKGATCLEPEDRLCLVRLSDGGGDAVEMREFDTSRKAFVAGGFRLPMGKQQAAWLDPDTLLIAHDFGPGTLTTSGYPYIVKELKRGRSLEAAREVFRGRKSEVGAGAEVLRGPMGEVQLVLLRRSLEAFQSRYWVLDADGQTRPLDLPLKTNFRGWLERRMILSLNEDWPAHGFAAGDLVAFEPATGAAELILHPSPTQSVDGAAVTQHHLIVALLDNVSGVIQTYARDRFGWRRQQPDLPAGQAVSIQAADHGSDAAYVDSESFLEPTTLWALDAAGGRLSRVMRLPPRFDAAGDVTEQRFAVSKDGTKVPYWLVRPKAKPPEGGFPTLMFGYGGFLISETPAYNPVLGKLWLERGGAYVVANIRGGGEFGPAWHEAARREHRQRAFDDFAAVARDLLARKITSPRRLAIYGRSNGGVLTSVSMIQHPELFHALVIESPLVDMLRYSHLSAGASWMGEYGDPDNPEDRKFISQYSAYQNLKKGVKYPEPYITTNTEDDRVHPGHARKLAAALEALGDPVLYYENTFGGHANDADPELNARRWARHYVYLAQKLMDR
jgi:prolyl oligopeptidase